MSPKGRFTNYVLGDITLCGRSAARAGLHRGICDLSFQATFPHSLAPGRWSVAPAVVIVIFTLLDCLGLYCKVECTALPFHAVHPDSATHALY